MRPARFEIARHFDAVVDFEPAAEAVAHVCLDQHRHIAAGSFHRLLHTYFHEAHPVFERSAVFVAPPVRVRRQELADQVAVSGVYFDGVESGFAGQFHGRAERFSYSGDFVFAQPPHEGGGVDVESGRSGQRRAAADAPVRHVAAVSDLDSGGGAFGVDGVGDPAQTRHDLRTQPQLMRKRQTVARYRSIGQRRHSDAAARDAAVVVVQQVGRRVARAHAFEGGGANRAVAEGQRSDFARSEQQRFFHFVVLINIRDNPFAALRAQLFAE